MCNANAATNLIPNGSFEAQVLPTGGATYFYQGSITGWNTYSSWRGIGLFNNAYQPVADGLNALQFEVPGDYISQSFATVAGQSYDLSYMLSSYQDGGSPYHSGLRVTVGNQDVFAADNPTNVFQQRTLSFTALSSTTTLKFLSVGNYNQDYAQLDKVSVTSAVPEPETYAMLLAGLGLVGAAVKRRKAKSV